MWVAFGNAQFSPEISGSPVRALDEIVKNRHEEPEKQDKQPSGAGPGARAGRLSEIMRTVWLRFRLQKQLGPYSTCWPRIPRHYASSWSQNCIKRVFHILTLPTLGGRGRGIRSSRPTSAINECAAGVGYLRPCHRDKTTEATGESEERHRH